MNPLAVIAENPLVYRLACGLFHSLWEGLLIAIALALLLPSPGRTTPFEDDSSRSGQDNTKPQESPASLRSAAPRAGGERPHIIEVHPADGATDVESNTDIRLRFDRAMDPTLAVLEWDFGSRAGYRLRGAMRYDPAAHAFTLPVSLTPSRKHDVTLNRKGFPHAEAYEGFRADDSQTAAPFRWSFATARPKPAAGVPVPRAVSVSPISDTEVALLTPVEVTFD